MSVEAAVQLLESDEPLNYTNALTVTDGLRDAFTSYDSKKIFPRMIKQLEMATLQDTQAVLANYMGNFTFITEKPEGWEINQSVIEANATELISTLWDLLKIHDHPGSANINITLQNLAQLESTRQILVKIPGLLDELVKISRSDDMNAVLATGSLAFLTSALPEKDAIKYIPTEKIEGVKNCLQSVLDGVSYNGASWSSFEVTEVLRFLALNDTLSMELVKLEIVPLLIQVFDLTHQNETAKEAAELSAASVLWHLAFKKENHETLKKYVQAWAIEKSKTAGTDLLKRLQGILWELRGEEKHSIVLDEKKEIKKEDTKHHQKQIMISYNWGSQPTVLKIKSYLEKAGFKVWLDLEQMRGSTLEAMATAVESSTIVCICATRKYKNSPNCRAEAEYAFKLRRNVIPLIMEKGYDPDGWLGFIIGSKLWVDASDPEKIGGVVDFVQKEIHTYLGQGTPHTPTLTLTSTPSSSSSSEADSKYLKWGVEEVSTWLKENNLSDYVSSFQEQRVDGVTLAWLKKKIKS